MTAVANYVKTVDLRVLDTLQGLAAHYGRSWCYPNLQTLRKLILRYAGRSMSVRTLIRHLNALIRQGYIKRIRRHQRHSDGHLILRSTCYVVIGRAIHRAGKLLAAATRFLAALGGAPPPAAVPLPAQSKTHILGSVMFPARL